MRTFLEYLENGLAHTGDPMWDREPWDTMRIRRIGEVQEGEKNWTLFYDHKEGEYLIGCLKDSEPTKIYLSIRNVKIHEKIKTLELVQEKYNVKRLGTFLSAGLCSESVGDKRRVVRNGDFSIEITHDGEMVIGVRLPQGHHPLRGPFKTFLGNETKDPMGFSTFHPKGFELSRFLGLVESYGFI